MARNATTIVPEEMQEALAFGYTVEEAEKGWCRAVGFGGAEKIEKLDYDPKCVYEKDKDAARAAAREGVTFIKGLPSLVPEGYYINTPFNRQAIETALARCKISIVIGEDGVCRQSAS